MPAPPMPDTPPPGADQEARNALVWSFLSLREAIGILGLILPVALLLWTVTLGGGVMRPSISAYYYTPMGGVFTGIMAAIAVFLWSYRGYAPAPGEVISDRATARIAALGAGIVALSPVAPPEGATYQPALLQNLLHPSGAGLLHNAGALLFFGALAVFSLVLFRRSAPGPVSTRKRRENRIYLICGLVIVGAIVAIALVSLRGGSGAVFWLESGAVLGFALSWLVKGDALRPLIGGGA